MALAPRAPLRSLALLLSSGKPRLSSLFSSALKAAPGYGTPAAPSVKHPGGSDAPIAPAIQPPSAPGQGSGSTCPQERVLHNKHPEDCTPETLTHKRSPKKHHHRNHKVREEPDAGVAADRSSRSSSLDNPKHPTPEPTGRARIDGGAVGKPSACTLQKYPKHSVPGGSCSTSQPLPDEVPKEHSDDHKGREDPAARAPRMSSRDNPGHPVHEP